MRLLTNPVILRMGFVLLSAIVAFVVGVWLIRRMRQKITEEQLTEAAPRASDDAGFTVAAYQGVIQRLKEQEKELDRLHKV